MLKIILRSIRVWWWQRSCRPGLKAMICDAFRDVAYPGDWCLRGSNEGDEPYLLENEFRGKANWQALDPVFLDQAPNGFSSALSFFSDEAFRFYLPAYLIADLDNQLKRTVPVFHLCYGLDDAHASEPVNPRRYGSRTWSAVARHKFSMFNVQQAGAIVAYLQYKAQGDGFLTPLIDQALRNYWLQAAGGTR